MISQAPVLLFFFFPIKRHFTFPVLSGSDADTSLLLLSPFIIRPCVASSLDSFFKKQLKSSQRVCHSGTLLPNTTLFPLSLSHFSGSWLCEFILYSVSSYMDLCLLLGLGCVSHCGSLVTHFFHFLDRGVSSVLLTRCWPSYWLKSCCLVSL